jgi:hypothetical protein
VGYVEPNWDRSLGIFDAPGCSIDCKIERRSCIRRWLLELVRREPDLTLEEIQCRLLDERQQKAGLGSVWRFFDRHGISFKKKRSRRRAGSA